MERQRTFLKDANYTTGEAVQVIAGYNRGNYTVLNSNGTIEDVRSGSNLGSAPQNIGDFDNVINLMNVGASVDMVVIETDDGKIYCHNTRANVSPYHKLFGSQQITDPNNFVEVPLAIPSNESIKQVCAIGGGDYDLVAIAILTDAGNVYTSKGGSGLFPGITTNGTNAAPELWLNDVKEIATIESSGNTATFGGFSALMQSGELWVSCAKNALCAGGSDFTWQKLNNDSDWASPIMSGHTNGHWVALKTDGKFYGNTSGFGAVNNLDYGTLNGNEPLVKTLGNLPGCNNKAQAPICILLDPS